MSTRSSLEKSRLLSVETQKLAEAVSLRDALMVAIEASRRAYQQLPIRTYSELKVKHAIAESAVERSADRIRQLGGVPQNYKADRAKLEAALKAAKKARQSCRALAARALSTADRPKTPTRRKGYPQRPQAGLWA
jgi:ubiquitin